jgi:serine/threonine protein kinase/tetratricopeptide (TPR) repeat protein
MNSDANRVKAIFLAAVEKYTSDQWAGYLEEACAGDQALRHQVEVLLRAHAGADSLFDQSASGPLATIDEPAVVEQPGTVIGPYKLLEQIGEGGFGVVFLAEQTQPVRRKVAMKVLKAGMDSKQVIARFEAERQALALMDHANIARVLDAGTTKGEPGGVRPGRPYFVMELVKGVPITRYCDEHRLTPRQRLELFIPVCQAVQHAHQKGIIHRDLKPSNVLVALYDGKPVPKVIDFGVAKAIGQPLTEQTLVTGFGAIVGTLEYMSPEQAEINQLDIDTRSDIYSLGVLLYELLTGSPPFSRKELEKAGMLEMLRVIREQEPSKPSTKLSKLSSPHAPREEPGLGTRSVPATLASIAANRGTEPGKLTKLVRGELDWIVMKALEKDRSRRYESANGFAMDIQRYLADEPVLACLPSVGYRLGKFLRRNRGAVLAAVVMLVLLLGGLMGTTIGLLQAHAQRQKAEENSRTAREAVDEYFTLVSEETLLEEPALEPFRKKLLEAALRYYQHFVHQQGDDPQLQAELVAAHFRIAAITMRVGPEEDWLPAFQQGVALLENLLCSKADASALQRLQTWTFRPHSGSGYYHEPDEVLPVFQKARTLYQELVHDHPTVPGFQHALAFCHGTIAKLQQDTGELEEALRSCEAAHALRQRLVEENAGVPEYRAVLAGTLVQRSNILANLGRVAEATATCREAVRIAEKLVTEFATVPAWRDQLTGGIYQCYGGLLEQADRLQEAEEAYRKMLAGQEALMQDYPTVPRYRAGTFRARLWLGELFWATGRQAEAAEVFRPVRGLGERISREDLYEQDRLAWFLATCPDPQFRDPPRAVELASRLVGRHPRNGYYWGSLGAAYYGTGNYREAVGPLEKALQLPTGHYEACCAGLQLAMAYRQLGQKDQARQRYDQALARMKEHGVRWLEVRRLRADADKVLGIEDKKD